ncbi:acetoin utilization protein AcuC [Pengzhenrongella sicca]|uniref:Acetoin utilization protein AcuC n=1 Tax=Pengzhenrongella sicca TaxID=2819238 RepID=A0A8A4ZB02_9MICO|nr:acetoin utilization protein AcuC [Pengzhenrongella sicca]QTE29160.1 acetoin utilization protein AcuC [Pengzhenrongella sicca]
MAESVRIIWTPALLDYDFGAGHPMSPLRLELTMDLARSLGLLTAPGVRVVGVEPASVAELRTVHDAAYVAAVMAASAGEDVEPAFGLGTEDDPVFPGMHEAAARIVAGSLAGAVAVWSGEAVHAVNITGGMHHAMPGAASGFCVYNDAAVAIRRLLADGAERVAYVDVDAHHGDGVEHIFWDDPRVLTVSVHESGRTLFPGTGHGLDIGGLGAEGTAVNVALPAGTGDAGWLRAIDAVVPAVVRGFAPDMIVSQHGCDAHALDPLANLKVSVDAQRRVAELLHGLAHEVAGGRWLALGGGGYAVVEVVPRAWSHLIAIAGHIPLDPETPLPASWSADVAERWGRTPPELMTDGASLAFGHWRDGYDPADDVDRAIRGAREAVFPHLGLDPQHD